MYCKICGKEMENNLELCRECEEKRKMYKDLSNDIRTVDVNSGFTDKNKDIEVVNDEIEIPSQEHNLVNEQEENLLQNDNISVDNTISDSNNVDFKGFGKAIRTIWVVSIIMSIMIGVLSYLFIFNADIGTGWEGLGNAILFIIFALVFYIVVVLVYIILCIKKIINKYFNNYKKSSMYLYIIVTSVLLMLIFTNYAFIPFAYLLSSTIILNIYKKNKIANMDGKSSNKKFFLILFFGLLLILIISKFVPLIIIYRQQFGVDSSLNYCKEYITSTDKYIYCKTYDRIKRINLDDKSVKYYGQDISYHRNLVYEDYIFYVNTSFDYRNMDLYVLNAKTGESKKIKRFDAASFTFNIQGDNAYFNVFKGAEVNPNGKNYVYNVKNSKLETLGDDINNILYVTNTKVYYCKNDMMSVYDIKTKKDNITDNECIDDIFTEYVGDDDVYYNQYRFVARETALYVFDALDSNNDIKIEDEGIDYYFIYYYDGNVYVFSTSDSYKTTNVLYYDFDIRTLVDTGLSFNGTVNNSVDEGSRYYAIIMKDDVMYYLVDNKIYSYNIKTRDNKELFSDVSKFGGIYKNYIYYFDEEDNMVRYNMKTKDRDVIEKNNNQYDK